MKFLLLSALVAVALAQPLELSEKELIQWESFKVKYMREYESAAEEAKRMKIFADHLKFISEHNAKFEKGEVTTKVGINQFADLTNEEFRAQMNGYRRPAVRRGMTFNMTLETDDNGVTVDWRKKGAVTPVKNQGQCGSCWSFSTTGSVEGQYFLKTKNLVSLSEQNLVDCSSYYGNEGCDGGLMDDAFEYIIANKGIDTEASYPYTGEDGSCHYKSKNVGATISGYVDVTAESESALQTAVKNVGPISVAMDASSDEFQLYESGIYGPSDCSSTELDHGVLVVGYGKQGLIFGKDYWLVKNSWGTDWGLSGYFMLARNKNNMCGVATQASYPVV